MSIDKIVSNLHIHFPVLCNPDHLLFLPVPAACPKTEGTNRLWLSFTSTNNVELLNWYTDIAYIYTNGYRQMS